MSRVNTRIEEKLYYQRLHLHLKNNFLILYFIPVFISFIWFIELYQNSIINVHIFIQYIGKFGKSANKATKIKRYVYHNGFSQSTSKPKYYTFNKKDSKVEYFIPYFTDGSLKATITITAKGMKKYRKVIILKRSGQFGNSEGRYFVYRTPGKKKKNMKVIIKMDHSKNSSGAFSLRYL